MTKLWVLVFVVLTMAACASKGLENVNFNTQQPGREGFHSVSGSDTEAFSTSSAFVEVNGLQYETMGVNVQGYKEFRRVRDSAVCVMIPAGDFYKRAYIDTPPDQSLEGEYINFGDMLYDKYEVTNYQVFKFLNSQETVYKDGIIYAPDGETPWAADHKWGLKFVDDTKAWIENGRNLYSSGFGDPVEPYTSDTPKHASPTIQTGYEDHPFVGGSGFLAEAYAKWVGGKLPRGMEYEKAAAGPSGLLFPWGQIDEKPDSTKCNGYLTGPKHTMPVGSYPKGVSPYGLHDMAGNVYERAYWDDGIPKDDTPASLATMIRGGSWVTSNWHNFRCVCRCAQPMYTMEGSVGFRVVVTEGLDAVVENSPKLRTFVDTSDAYYEAEERNCPIFLYLGYET